MGWVFLVFFLLLLKNLEEAKISADIPIIMSFNFIEQYK